MINKNIPENVKWYIAGLFAGDGHVYLHKPILDKISNILNTGNVILVKKSEKDVRNFYKQQWRWTLNSNDAMEFLEMINIYLPEKSKQAHEAINFQKWKNKNTKTGTPLTKDKTMYCEKVVETVKMLKKQFTSIEDVEKYNLFKKKHYNPDIESGLQSTLGGFDDDFFTISEENKKVDDESKKLISPDIDLNVIENMTNPGFAGFFDAEGTVHISKNNNYKNSVYALNVYIGNSNFLILSKYCKTFGGSLSDPEIGKDDNKIMWRWQITATNALNFLEKISLYTNEKYEQINLAIEFQTRRNEGTLTQEKAEYIRHKIMDLHHTEYMLDGKIMVLPYGNEKKTMEYDNNNFSDNEN